eukprot:5902442-Pyramimonas_sp.AAC.1
MQRALEGHLEAFQGGRSQRKWPRMDRGGKDAREGCPSSLYGLTVPWAAAPADRPGLHQSSSTPNDV